MRSAIIKIKFEGLYNMGKRVISVTKREQKLKNVTQALVEEFAVIGITIYLLIVFVMLPLYVHDHYYEMAFHKWRIYFYSTLGFLVFSLCIRMVHCTKMKQRGCFLEKIRNIKRTSILAILYGVSVLVTMFSCGYPRAAWQGTDSWYMGALAQLLFIATFLFFSNINVSENAVIWMNLMASAICYIIGILQRYGWDIFHYYYGMSDEVVRDYLSTIGNRTWYSGYISVVFPIGVYLFWVSGHKKERYLSGIYTFLAFAAIVTNNSDSIYLAVVAVFFGLFVMSVDNLKKIYRWVSILVIWFLACSTMSGLRFFSDYIRDLRGLSKVFLNIRFSLGGLLVVSGVAFWLYHLNKKNGWKKEVKPKVAEKTVNGILIFAFIMVLVLVGIIIANTTGCFQKWFGFTIDNKYLLFDDDWGDSRGFNWKMTLQMFGELPLFQKLFGIGSDCYAVYAYSNPAYAEVLRGYFGTETMVANSHNEWLNALLCTGIIGSLLYIGLFLSVMRQCFTKCVSVHTSPIVPAVGLCVLGYMAHNMFCYQQICATGPIFLLMGIATQKMRRGGNGQA